MDIRVLVLVEVLQPVHNRLRLLRGGGVIQPNQRPPIHPLMKNGKVAPDLIDVERRRTQRRIDLNRNAVETGDSNARGRQPA